MFYILIMNNNSILPVVLAGGKSQRFGEDKSQVQLGKKILIDYILSEIIDDFEEVLIVTNNPIKHLSSNKIFKIEDFITNLGPLGGILSAMKWIKNNKKKYKWLATFPSDTPFFNNNIMNNFFNKVDENESDLFFIKSDNKLHNIFGLWSLNLIDQLEKDLKNGSRKVEKWANNTGVKIINMSFEKKDPFFNINTREDLIEAEKILND